jgi:hypothetical protein
MAKKRETELDGTVVFPLVKKKMSEDTIAQMWEFLNHTLVMKKEFRRSIYRNNMISLLGRRYWFRIHARGALQFFFHIADAQAITEANRHGELILGFLNTLRRDELRHMHIAGSFSTNDPKMVPRRTASLLDRGKLVRLGNKLKVALKPMGQLIELTQENADWLITTANFDHSPMVGLFFHMPKEGVIPSDLIRSVLQSCTDLGRQMKRPLDSI